MSKKINWVEEVEKNNKNQVMLKKKWLKIKVMKKKQLLIEEVEEKSIEKIKKSKAKNDKVVKVIKEIKKAKCYNLKILE